VAASGPRSHPDTDADAYFAAEDGVRLAERTLNAVGESRDRRGIRHLGGEDSELISISS